MPSPFVVTPWQENFLASLLQRIFDEHSGSATDLSSVLCIFPHGRPEKYLTYMLRQRQRGGAPCILPQSCTVSDLFTRMSIEITQSVAWDAGLLDRVGLLLECVRKEDAWHDMPPQAHTFFPWGVRLASLFEECFVHTAEPENFLHMEGQAPPFAVRLLEHLGNIFTRYRDGLRTRGWTTPGHNAAIVAEYLRTNGDLSFSMFEGKTIYIAGFYALTTAEEKLFHALWKAGATVMLHADPALTSVKIKPHWSCEPLQQWAKDWKTTFVSAGSTEIPAAAPIFRYYAGFDLHSQLTALQQELKERDGEGQQLETGAVNGMPGQFIDDSEILAVPGDDGWRDTSGSWQNVTNFAADTAIVLPDCSLLMPALHHLPRMDINISMGYPLTRSPLFRLLDTLLCLQENRRESGYYWRDLVELVRHPYVKMLRPRQGVSAKGGSSEITVNATHSAEDAFSGAPREEREGLEGDDARRTLHRFEQLLRTHGRKYIDPHQLLQDFLAAPGVVEEAPSSAVQAFMQELFSATLSAFGAVQSPKAMARALEGVCSLLLAHGEHLWARFPIDAECLYRITQSLIPELAHSALATEEFSPQALFTLTRKLMDAERVPFEATPLVGLQVMGVLETRLLSFRRVYILDAVEESLPGSVMNDPLLPQSLRPVLGLPDMHTHEQVSAYHFFRLIQGAEEVVVLWQEGTDSLDERKKRKSRFVEELLWKEEQKQKRIFRTKGQDGPLSVLSAEIFPIYKKQTGIAVTPELRALMRNKLARPVSASLLDAYLHCPVKFLHERLLNIASVDSFAEDADPLSIGQMFHGVLQEFYATRSNLLLPEGEMLVAESEELLEIFHAHLQQQAFFRTMPADEATVLICAAEKRLTHFLQHQPPTTVLALEHTMTTPFLMPLSALDMAQRAASSLLAAVPLEITLMGKADRIDRRDDTLMILDYKTGRLPSAHADIWGDALFWRSLADCSPESMQADTRLLRLADSIGSIQLPFYMYLLAKTQTQTQFLGMHKESSLARCNAAWVDLANEGKEVPLFKETPDEIQYASILSEYIPAAIRFITTNMLTTPYFLPHIGKHCDWCSCIKMCMMQNAQ